MRLHSIGLELSRTAGKRRHPGRFRMPHTSKGVQFRMRTMNVQTIIADLERRPMRMKQFLVAVVCGMAALTAPAVLARAQAPLNSTATSKAAGQGGAQSQVQVQVYAPSDIAILPSSVPSNHRSRGRQGSPTNVSARTGSAHTHNGANIPRPCFQPGVGWSAMPGTGNANESDQGSPHGQGLANGNPEGRPAANSSPTAHSPVRRPVSAGTAECFPMSQPQGIGVAGADGGASPAGFKDNLLNPAPNPVNPTAYSSLPASMPGNSTWNESGSGDAKSALVLPGLRKTSEVFDPTDPGAALDELKGLQHRAYISSVKLRRLSRNVQDLRTRLELRQMNSEMEKRAASQPSGNENTSAGMGNAAGRKKAGRHGSFVNQAECERKTGSSKSKVCAQLKH